MFDFLLGQRIADLRKKHGIYPGRLNRFDVESVETRIRLDAEKGGWQNFFGYQAPDENGQGLDRDTQEPLHNLAMKLRRLPFLFAFCIFANLGNLLHL